MFFPHLSTFVVVKLLSHVQLLRLHAKLPCSTLSPGVCSDSWQSSWWSISSSIVPFSSCLQSFPASGSFPMSQFFTSGGQCIRVSASASVLPMNIQGWFPLGLPGLSSLQSKELSRVLSRTYSSKVPILLPSVFFMVLCVKVTQSCLTLYNPMDYTVHGILQARILKWVAFLSLLQQIFSTQILNPGILHCRWILYQLNHKGSPRILEWVACPFSRGSSWPRNWTAVFCIAGGFFTNWAMREA